MIFNKIAPFAEDTRTSGVASGVASGELLLERNAEQVFLKKHHSSKQKLWTPQKPPRSQLWHASSVKVTARNTLDTSENTSEDSSSEEAKPDGAAYSAEDEECEGQCRTMWSLSE